ncbi:MAG: hypothetical protein AABX69_01390 [Nanoarchaeota archaeon]
MGVQSNRGREGLDGLIEEALNSNELVRKPQAQPIKPQSLLQRIVLSKWLPFCGLSLGGLWHLAAYDLSYKSFSENLPFTGSVSALGFIAAGLLKQDWLIREAEAVRRRFRPLYQKILSLPFEHPEIIAAGCSIYLTAQLSSSHLTSLSFSDFVRYPLNTLFSAGLTGLVAATTFSISYSATSLLFGRVLNPETRKTLWQGSAAIIQTNRRKYREAIANISQLLETQRSYKHAVELQTLIGDLKLLSGDLSSIDTYTNAIATEKTSYVGRSDWLLKPVIGMLKNKVKEAKKPAWAEAEDLTCVIAATQAFSEGKIEVADTLLASAVNKERYSFLAHQARAALMRRTERHATADLEMRITGELLLQEKEQDFEQIEGSRNRVLQKGRVVLKLNEKAKPLEDEREVTKLFREGFGQEVIYSLPVYRLGPDYTLLSEKDVSDTMLDLILQRKARLEDFVQARNLLVRLQKFGYDLYKAKRLPLDDSILRIDFSKPDTWYFANRRLHAVQRIERFNGVSFPESFKDAVTKDLLFVDRRLASYPHLTMYKDYNPKNVLKRLFGLMQALDFELQSLRLMPPQIDFVNFLEFAPYLTPKQIRWILEGGVADFEDVNDVKLDRDLFFLTHEDAGLQWHFERLIYRSGEAATAKDDVVREEKTKQQVRHYLASRRHLDTIIEEQHLTGKELEGALRAREELERPIFADRAEYDRLCRIVEREEKDLLMRKPLPVSKTRLAVASAGAATILTVSLIGAVSVRNNLVPILNTPVFPQGDKVMLAVTEVKELGGIKRYVPGPRSVKYYVIDAASDEISFLSEADNLSNTDLSAFQDKVLFVRDGRVTLYDFVNKEHRTVIDERFKNPVISPSGLWIASNVEMKYLGPNMNEVWLIRPSDMRTRRIIDFQNSFLPPWSSQNSWSPDGSYLIFLSNNENTNDSPDRSKVWLNSLNMSSYEVHRGPLISDSGRGVFTWSSDGLLAYVVEQDGKRQQINLSDSKFRSSRLLYSADNTGFINDIAFAGKDRLIVQSNVLFVLNVNSLEQKTLDGTFLEDVSKDGSRFLYGCNTPADICEFDIVTGSSRNLTNTPSLKEPAAVYSPNGKKIYVAAYPQQANCARESCPQSLFVIDPSTGTSRLLQHETNGDLRYSLIAP